MGSPTKSGTQSGSGAQALNQQMINQLESYVGQQQQSERGAIAGLGPNPYFKAAEQMNPAAYKVNPGATQTFGSTGPGTYLENLSSITGQPKATETITGSPGGPPGGGGGKKAPPPTAPPPVPNPPGPPNWGGNGHGPGSGGPVGHQP